MRPLSRPMIKYGNIALTTTITLLTLYHLYMLLIVRLGGYIVNLSDFYSYRIIGKLIVFTTSGVQLVEHDREQFHFRRAAYSPQLKSKCGNVLTKTATSRINLNLDGTPITTKSHTHPRDHTRKLLVY
jgi:hypothetical protein